MDKKSIDVKDEHDVNQLRNDLNNDFDRDNIVVSEDLIQRTLKLIENGERPRISEILREEKIQKENNKKQVIKYIKRVGGLAAVFAVFILCIKVLDISGVKKSSEKSDNSVSSITETSEESATDATKEEATTDGQSKPVAEDSTNEATSDDIYVNFINMIEGEVKEVEVTRAGSSEVETRVTDTSMIQNYIDLLKNTEMRYEQANLDSWDYKIVCNFEDDKNYYEVYVCKDLLYVIIMKDDFKQIMSYQVFEYNDFVNSLEKLISQDK